MIVSVTQKHIDDGRRGSCDKDLVALALLEAGYKNVWVSPDRIRANGLTYEMPPEVARFVRDLDQMRFVDPFEFELEG
jgi:hypothetical protein